MTYIQRLGVFLLLFVDYAQAEVNLMGLVELRVHRHDFGKCLLGMLQRAISIIENTDAVPQAWFFRIGQFQQGILVSLVCLLKVVHHEVTMTCRDSCQSL